MKALQPVCHRSSSSDCLFSEIHLLVVSKRRMAPGIPDIEGSPHGHDVIPVKSAVKYLSGRGLQQFASIYDSIKPHPNPYLYIGSTKEVGANRVVFGEAVNSVLDGLSKEEAAKKVMVIDSASNPCYPPTSILAFIRYPFR